MWYWLFKYVFMGPLLSLLGRPKVEGLEYVPDSGAVILASNHLAVADSFYLCLVVKRRITYLAKAEYFTGTGLKGWFTRWFYTAAGQVPIDRTDADAAQGALTTARAHPRSRASCSACTPRAPAHPTDGCTRARPGWPGWRWRPASRHSGRDDRNRRRQPAGQQDVALRPGRGPLRQADGLLPVRGAGG